MNATEPRQKLAYPGRDVNRPGALRIASQERSRCKCRRDSSQSKPHWHGNPSRGTEDNALVWLFHEHGADINPRLPGCGRTPLRKGIPVGNYTIGVVEKLKLSTPPLWSWPNSFDILQLNSNSMSRIKERLVPGHIPFKPSQIGILESTVGFHTQSYQ